MRSSLLSTRVDLDEVGEENALDATGVLQRARQASEQLVVGEVFRIRVDSYSSRSMRFLDTLERLVPGRSASRQFRSLSRTNTTRTGSQAEGEGQCDTS